MRLGRVLFAVGSIGLTVALLALLVRVGNLNVLATLRLVRNASPIAFVKLLLLNILLVIISTKKWRSVDAVLRTNGSSVPCLTESLVVTSAGMALGLVLPVQLGMTTARTMGTYFHGQALTRGMAATIFEQSFDVLVVVLFAIGSILTRILLGGGTLWAVLAATIIGFGLLLTGPTVRLIHGLTARAQSDPPHRGPLKFLSQRLDPMQLARVLKESLARRLALLAVIRFVVVVAMAAETAAAVGFQIPFWHFAAAVPFVFVATLVSITPGALGVNELTFATVLSLFGTPLAVGTQWSLVNRILGTAACIVVALCAVIALLLQKCARRFRLQVPSRAPEQG